MVEQWSPRNLLSRPIARRGATQPVVHPIPQMSPSDAYAGRPSSMCRFIGAASSDAHWSRPSSRCRPYTELTYQLPSFLEVPATESAIKCPPELGPMIIEVPFK